MCAFIQPIFASACALASTLRQLSSKDAGTQGTNAAGAADERGDVASPVGMMKKQ
jgi:hypothetical protein